jgi:hypothetical protein
MAKATQPVIVVPSLTVTVAEKVMSLALMSGHVGESDLGVCPETTVGSSLLKARASLKEGFTIAFFSNLRPFAKIVEKESAEVQALYLDILKTINAEKPELVTADSVKVDRTRGERNLNTLIHNLKN